jgi:hypothetical protein
MVSIATAPGCAAAQERKDVQVAESGTTTVNFAPRECGAVTLDIAPAGARFAFVRGGTEVTSGNAPAQSPVQLAEGTYTLRVSAKYCADFSATVKVASGGSSSQRVRLICQ